MGESDFGADFGRALDLDSLPGGELAFRMAQMEGAVKAIDAGMRSLSNEIGLLLSTTGTGEQTSLNARVGHLEASLQAVEAALRWLPSELEGMLQHGGALSSDRDATTADEAALEPAVRAVEEALRTMPLELANLLQGAASAVTGGMSSRLAEIEAKVASAEEAAVVHIPSELDDVLPAVRAVPERVSALEAAMASMNTALRALPGELDEVLRRVLPTVATLPERVGALEETIASMDAALRGLPGEFDDVMRRFAAPTDAAPSVLVPTFVDSAETTDLQRSMASLNAVVGSLRDDVDSLTHTVSSLASAARASSITRDELMELFHLIELLRKSLDD